MNKVIAALFLAAPFFVFGQQVNFVGTQSSYNPDGSVNYALLSNWAAHPWKKDYSDSVPKPLRKSYVQDSTVDVFFVHPTTYFKQKKSMWNAAIDDEEINTYTDKFPILYQASVFNESARVFAPRFRQAVYEVFFTKNTGEATIAVENAYNDVKAAFEYFLTHFNNNRPIIIASHSQGSMYTQRLLKEYFENKPLQNRLVAAYIIGMPVDPTSFTVLQPCKDSLQTGCYITWRTYNKKYKGKGFFVTEPFNAVATNPLNWTIDETYAGASLNTGGMMKNFNKLIKGIVDAQVKNGVLLVSKPKFFGKILLRRKNYHIGDYNLFYMNIRQDVKRRISLFWK